MNADQRPDRMRQEAATTTTAPRAKQGDRRTYTFWILVFSTLAAIIVGAYLMATREEFTAKPPAPVENAPGPQSPPVNPQPSQ
jgi:hypothetical protein